MPERRDPILPGSPGPMSSLSASPLAPARQPMAPPPGPTVGGPTVAGPGGADAGFGPAARGPAGGGLGGPSGPGHPVPPPGAPRPSVPPPGAVPGAGDHHPSLPQGGDLWADLAKLDTGPRPVVPGGPRGNGPGPQAGRPTLDPASGGTTASGLSRRVRGAQLPSTQPLSLRRSREDAGSDNRDYGRDDHGAASGNGDAVSGDTASGDSGPAKDVYSFLSSFTAGVQRGLDEARRDTKTPEDES